MKAISHFNSERFQSARELEQRTIDEFNLPEFVDWTSGKTGGIKWYLFFNVEAREYRVVKLLRFKTKRRARTKDEARESDSDNMVTEKYWRSRHAFQLNPLLPITDLTDNCIGVYASDKREAREFAEFAYKCMRYIQGTKKSDGTAAHERAFERGALLFFVCLAVAMAGCGFSLDPVLGVVALGLGLGWILATAFVVGCSKVYD